MTLLRGPRRSWNALNSAVMLRIHINVVDNG